MNRVYINMTANGGCLKCSRKFFEIPLGQQFDNAQAAKEAATKELRQAGWRIEAETNLCPDCAAKVQ